MKKVTRRRFSSAILALTTASILPNFSHAESNKAPKNAVQYQKEPLEKNGQIQKCSNCRFWIPGEQKQQEQKENNEVTMGKCQIVSGKIHPNAWCNLWSKEVTNQ